MLRWSDFLVGVQLVRKALQDILFLHVTDIVLGCSRKLTAELDKLSKIIDAEHRLIVAAIQRLVDLTEAFRMELANSLQSGPLSEMRAQILRSREQVLRKAKPKGTRRTGISSISSQGSPEPLTRESKSSDASEHGPWHGKIMLSFGKNE